MTGENDDPHNKPDGVNSGPQWNLTQGSSSPLATMHSDVRHAQVPLGLANNEDEVQSRLATCRACEFRAVLPIPLLTASRSVVACKKCGCVMNLKARVAGSTCPIGKF